MAGLYLHIPFCRQACRYCDFYFTVSLQYREKLVNALLLELEQRSDRGMPISTIYLGGGTPSVLELSLLQQLMKKVGDRFSLATDAEITMEANPDDLNKEYLNGLLDTGFNRLSIGIQSFHNPDLELMRRSHNAEQARSVVENAVAAGFKNITIDLIYGIPGQSKETWNENLAIATSLPIQHLSAYHLTFEPGTVFHHWLRRKRISEVSEKESVEQYAILREQMQNAGFKHYEISNFARSGFNSRHNSAYWEGFNYLGVGPAAHSYNGHERRWNISSVKRYMEAMVSGESYFEKELLTQEMRFNERLIVSLRRSRGISLEALSDTFPRSWTDTLLDQAENYLKRGVMELTNGHLRIAASHWLTSDAIMEHLIRVENP